MRVRRFAISMMVPAVLAMMGCSSAYAASEPTVTTSTRSVAAFKNGIGFFVREGEARLVNGWATTEIVPAAALGTFWIGSSKPGVSIERLTALEEEVLNYTPAISIPELLAANVGKQVRIKAGDREIQGKLISVPEDRLHDPNKPTYPVHTAVLPPAQGQIIIIETDTGTTAVGKHITWVDFHDSVNTYYTAKERVKRFRFKVNGATDSVPVTMGYLQKGLSWSPAYLVDLVSEDRARITMQGLLVNDVEDIEGADVHFVVGYPNFMFADKLSPLGLTQSLTQFVQGMGRTGDHGLMNVMTQSFGYGAGGYTPPPGSPGLASARPPSFDYSTTQDTPGAHEEDLFLYEMKDVSLKRGERAYYTIFSAEIPYEHSYEWTARDISGIQTSGYRDERRSDQPTPEDQVWHKLKLTNSSNFPWTTAPGMVMSNGQPLSQDTLDYTSVGAVADLNITIASDISARQSELERDRENEALRVHGQMFARVTSDGQLTLKNYKSQEVTVTVKKRVVGEVVSASDQGNVEKTTEGVRSINPNSLITWNVQLQPGEEKVLDYTYATFARY